MNTLEKIYMRTKMWSGIALLLILSACGGSKNETTATNVEVDKSPLSEQLMMSTLWMQKSAEAKYLQRQAFKLAEEKMKANTLSDKSGRSLAIIVDLDETILDNSPYEARLVISGQTFSKESWKEWVNKSEADAIKGAPQFLRFADDLGLEVFYISNRDEDMLEPTIQNLQRLELPFADPAHVLLRQGGFSNKYERRYMVKQQFQVVLLVGDQMTDFHQEPFTEQDDIDEGYVTPLLDSAQNFFVLLPNPMYGTFESNLYDGKKGLSDEAKVKIRRQALEPKMHMAR